MSARLLECSTMLASIETIVAAGQERSREPLRPGGSDGEDDALREQGEAGAAYDVDIPPETDMTEADTASKIDLPAAAFLKIAALDPEDLAILSAHLQDAEVRVGDMTYLPQTQRFALFGARFDWYAAGRGLCERCGTGLHFERVSRVRRAGFDQEPDTVLTLLAVSFMPTDAPAGTVMLHFSNDGAVRLDVECLEAALSDIGPRWTCGHPPARDGVPKQTQLT